MKISVHISCSSILYEINFGQIIIIILLYGGGCVHTIMHHD